MKERTTRWFLEPRNGATNESIAEHLANIGASPTTAENMRYGLKDSRGKSHDVIEVGYALVAKIQQNKQGFRFQFKIWNMHEGDSFVREWEFPKYGPLGRTRKVQEMRKRLATYGGLKRIPQR